MCHWLAVEKVISVIKGVPFYDSQCIYTVYAHDVQKKEPADFAYLYDIWHIAAQSNK